jgi:N-methylhydantoinase B
VESEFPVRVERYELATDSAGPGTFRGGLGVRRQWRNLAEETNVNLRMDRFKFSSPGVFGAKPAKASKAVLNPGDSNERALTSKIAGLRFKRDELLSVEFAGGGGLGNPLERDPARVREDVVRGYVSLAGAREDYGVVLDPASLEVDAPATARLRQTP